MNTNLRKVLESEFGPGDVNRIIDLLQRSGIVKPDVDRLQAASISHANAIEAEGRRTAHRLGLTVSASGQISPDDLATRLSALPVEERLRLKTLFASAGLIR
jgi:hypothetical protein